MKHIQTSSSGSRQVKIWLLKEVVDFIDNQPAASGTFSYKLNELLLEAKARATSNK